MAILQTFQRRWYDEIAFQRGHKTSHSRPTFIHWLKISWLDILGMLIIGAVAIGFDQMWPPYRRLFPYRLSDGTIADPSIAYPKRAPSLNSAVAAVVSIGGPLVVFLVSQIWLRSFWNVNNAIFGLLYSNVAGTCFQIIVKTLVGGLRPHFLDVCKPNISNGQGIDGIYFDRSACTGDPKDIKNALISFPSGHTVAAFASFGFLFLWLNANMKVNSSRRTRFWKVVILYIPILGAVLIAGNLQMTYNHHWHDIIAGAVIGIVFAFSSYRCMFESVWDPLTNDRPLLHERAVVSTEKETIGAGSSSEQV